MDSVRAHATNVNVVPRSGDRFMLKLLMAVRYHLLANVSVEIVLQSVGLWTLRSVFLRTSTNSSSIWSVDYMAYRMTLAALIVAVLNVLTWLTGRARDYDGAALVVEPKRE